MRIVFITPGMTFGGAERVISILANNWVKNGHEVSIFITATDEDVVYKIDPRINIDYFLSYSKKKVSPIRLLSEIRSYVLQKSPDAVISFMNDVCAYSVVALFCTGIPVIFSERNDPTNTNQRLKDRLYNLIVKLGSKVVVFQTKGAKELYPKYVQHKSNIILNPIEIESIPLRIQPEKNMFTIVNVGRLEPQKNQLLLIDAFSIVHKEFPKTTLKIYGEGSLRNCLQKKIRELHLESAVLLMGSTKNVLDDIKSASCFVLSSDFEGLPNALIEAMCIGLPCISTDCSPGGARELINNYENGVIVSCDDTLELSQAIIFLIENYKEAEGYGLAALELRNVVNCNRISAEWISMITRIIKD